MNISVDSKNTEPECFKMILIHLQVKHKSQACIAKLLNVVFCFLKKVVKKSDDQFTFPSHHSCWTC